jgi:hypothetical protein
LIIALWISGILLTLVYLLSGVSKTFRSKAALEPRMAYIEDFSTWQVKGIGVVEILGALGVILPLATGIAPVITGVAAIGLVIVQVVAIAVHVRRKEGKSVPVNIVLLLLAVVVAVLRFVTL